MKTKVGAALGLVLPLALVFAGGSTGFAKSQPAATTQSNGPLVLWVDAPRVSAVKAFEKAYPHIKVEMNIINDNIGNDALRGKFQLFNEAGSGWPDAIFTPTNSDISWMTSPQIHYAANLTNLVPKSIQNGYAPAANAACHIDGKVMCLRNDDAADVLWYNAKLFKEWHYTPPKTWPQYEALGLKIAKQHPGYYVGLIGNDYTFDRYFWGSGCPANELVGPNTVKIDLQSPDCTRMVKLLDTLLKAKVLSTAGLFSSQSNAVAKKLVMTPGATWYGEFEFNDAWHIPAGQITATYPLTWPGFPYTGDEGGGMWVMSSHISGKLRQEALKFIEFVATNPKNQVDLAPTFPAYGPDEQAWLQKNVVDAHYFADPQQIVKAFKQAVKMVWTGHPYTEFDPDGIWDTTVVPALEQGKNLAQIWPTYQRELVNYAQLYGYNVKQ
ncbi:MAG: ABC transporter substrate-binding protein [Firmicutes bacterium]|nr:ABC transporter substrate-binding protein [Bacillota bacterium]